MSLFSVIMCCFQTWFPDMPGGKWRENRSKHLPQLSRSLPEILTACFSWININKIRKNENYLTVDILVIVISNATRGKTVHWGRDGKVNYGEWTRGDYQIPSLTLTLVYLWPRSALHFHANYPGIQNPTKLFMKN